MLRHFLYFLSNLLRPFSIGQNFLLFEDKLAEGMHQKTKEIIVPRGKFCIVENSDHFLTHPSFHQLVFKRKSSVSCSEFHLVQNDLNLRKMRFSIPQAPKQT